MRINLLIWRLAVVLCLASAVGDCFAQIAIDPGALGGAGLVQIPNMPGGALIANAIAGGMANPGGGFNGPQRNLGQVPGRQGQLQNQQPGLNQNLMANFPNGLIFASSLPGGAFGAPLGVVNGQYVGGAFSLPGVMFYDAGDGSAGGGQRMLTRQELIEQMTRKRMARLTSVRARAVADREAMQARKAKRAAAAAR